MGFIKIVFSGLILALLCSIAVIILNTFFIKILAKFLDLKDKTYKSAFKFAFFSGLFNFILCFLVFPLKNLVLLLQAIGLALFFFINYRLAVWVYEKASKKHIRLLFLIVTFFTIILNFFIAFLITELLKVLQIPII